MMNGKWSEVKYRIRKLQLEVVKCQKHLYKRKFDREACDMPFYEDRLECAIKHLRQYELRRIELQKEIEDILRSMDGLTINDLPLTRKPQLNVLTVTKDLKRRAYADYVLWDEAGFTASLIETKDTWKVYINLKTSDVGEAPCRLDYFLRRYFVKPRNTSFWLNKIPS
ncbi:MAG: hypothetical protein AAGM67_08455 [Bacteroidota bacterium]